MTIDRQDWIKARLDKIGKKQADLARETGLPSARISEIIAGKRQLQASEIPRLSHALAMPAGEVLMNYVGDSGFPPRPQLATGVRHLDPPIEKYRARIFQAVQETLDVMRRHDLNDMTDYEIETYAKAIADITSKPGLIKQQSRRTKLLQETVINLQEIRKLKGE